MKLITTTTLFCCLLLSMLFEGNVYAETAKSVNLKQTMEQMRLQYKRALDSQSAESFNQYIDSFKSYLSQAQAYNFSPDRKAVSLEGRTKVQGLIADIPSATDDNLAELQNKLATLEDIREEYHKKAKPSVWDLLFSLF